MFVLPGYVVEQVLHRGRETTIFRATRESDGLPVAVKLCARAIPTPSDRARLRYEYELLQELTHTGIVRAIGLETTSAGPALILELLKGTPLDEYLLSAKLTLQEGIALAIKITTALAAIHSHKIVHKDIKPHHVFFDTDSGEVCLFDFGIATRLGHIAMQAGGPIGLEGTLAYLSPEQTGRVNQSPDRRSDLYSLGVLLYELFTGVLPFTSIDPMELLYSHVARRPLAPHLRSPQIPEALSAIIMKLLAKAPEERYQSALGLRADLTACARYLARNEPIPANMPLGTRDFPYEFMLSHKLYGREKERAELLRILESVRAGQSCLTLISGYSGVGKSVLVAELRKALMEQGGLFAGGKFDPLNRNTPYSSVAHALRELLQQILAQDSSSISRWRTRLSSALGESASSLAMMIPELSSLIGPLPGAVALGPAESQNRFDIAVDALIRAFCQNGQPLVLVLDDLQWADPASLRLLQVLFSQGAPHGLLVVGAYRDNEVDDSHPLHLTLAGLRREGVQITQINLTPLHFEDLQLLLIDSLKLPAETVQPLARCVFDKTQGNPFFSGQFLTALYRDGQLYFSTDHERWEWNLPEIERRSITDNVIDFLSERLKRLPTQTQQIARLAACIGHEFDLHTLAVIAEQPAESLFQSLQNALRDGIIMPLHAEHRYTALLEEGAAGQAQATYRFIHDRIYEAAYALIPERDRAAVRLRIGRLLRASLDGEKRSGDDGAQLFSITNHFNAAQSILTDPEELHSVAVLNLRAGTRAREGAAFPTAAEYFRIGLSICERSTEKPDQRLQIGLLLGLAECESLCGHFESAEHCFDRVDILSPTLLDRARATCLRLKLYQVAGRFREGVQRAEQMLQALDITLPSNPDSANAAIAAEVADIPRNMGDRSIEELLDAPLVADPKIQVAIELLVNAAPCAYIGQPEAFPFIALKMLNLSLQHGNTPASCFAYSVYGFMLVAVFGDAQAGARFSEMSIQLNEKLHDISLRGTLLHLHGDHINFWVRHIRTDLPILERAFIACQQAGDYVYANYLAFETIWQLFEIGVPLEDILAESERFARFSKKTRNEAVYQTIRLQQQFFRSLSGKTDRPLVLSEAGYDPRVSKKIIEDASFGCGIAFGHIIDLLLAFFRDDMPAARAACSAAVPYLGAVMAMPIEATFHFFRALTFLRSLQEEGSDASAEEIKSWRATAESDLERLARWAKESPETFEAKFRIVKAEIIRASGNTLAALTEYDAAIGAAETSGFPHYAALACDLASRCLLSVRRPRPASMYLALAQRHMQNWGSSVLASRLEVLLAPIRPYLSLISQDISPEAPQRPANDSTSREVTERLLDVATVLKAAQAIASEIEMDRLLEQVMGIVLTNSGAQRGVLVLQKIEEESAGQSGSPPATKRVIVAIAAIEPDVVRVGLSIPLEQSEHELAVSIVGLVAHTRDTLILSNPQQDARFAADPYLRERQPRSMLCMPLLHQNKLTGVLYLENGIVRDVFTQERIELLRLLCAQVAIALENARLYERLRTTSAAVHEANGKLEAEVASRTAELHAANQSLLRRGNELDDINRRLEQELADRMRTEKERAELQERIIRTQQARLAEMATPLIPISSDVVVMPLIGTVDSERASQILDTALTGAQNSQARFVILDITGLRHIDTSVAGTLVRTARALQLLGTVAIITGIRAEVAQTLVSLGIDLGGIVCLNQLQNGIAYAQKRRHT